MQQQRKTDRVVIIVDEPQLVSMSQVYLSETGNELQIEKLFEAMLFWKFYKVGMEHVQIVSKVNFGRTDWQTMPNYLTIGNQLNNLNFNSERIRPKQNNKERGIEVGIACWLWANQHQYDTVFIVSGDSDIADILVTLRNKRKQVHYVEYKNSAHELNQIVQSYNFDVFINKNQQIKEEFKVKNPYKQ